VLALGPLAGCSSIEDTTGIDFRARFDRSDALTVLKESRNGDERARALGRLNEPLAHGGTEKQQELVLNILTTTATSDELALCRLKAIDVLRTFHDPRACKAIEEAYYRAGLFTPETAIVIRCTALQAMGQTGRPEAIGTLVKVLREPPVDGSEVEKQQKMDERIAAARALGHFSQPQATSALLEAMRNGQDIALSARAHESLVSATGRDIPADPKAWSDYLDNPNNPDTAVARQGVGDRLLRLTGWKSQQSP
jgi:hypothetical protein